MNIELVKEVRQRSNAPLGDCKKALEEAGGDVEKALVVLQKRGAARAVARGGRITTEGRVHTYIHGEGRLAVMVEINCETDFVARNPAFKEFCDNVAMQIAGMSPEFVRREDVPEWRVGTQRQIFEEQLRAEKKPETAWPKIIDGKLNRWFSEICLMDQHIVTDYAAMDTVENVRAKLVATLGENITVRRFVRWELGEGVEKRATNLAAEVAKLTGV